MWYVGEVGQGSFSEYPMKSPRGTARPLVLCMCCAFEALRENSKLQVFW